MSVFVKTFDGAKLCYGFNDSSCIVSDLMQFILRKKEYPSNELQLLHNGRVVGEDDPLKENGTYYAILGLKGGKGGFGAMLRMLGAQIEKTTNREACRDLSGRRMRDVNNEKQLQSWIEKAKQLEEERERKRREKLERMRSRPKHYFVDPSYDQQKEDVLESLEEAVSKGIDVAGPSGSTAASTGSLKRKAADEDDEEDEEDEDDLEFKKHCMWLGLSGYDEDDDEDEEDIQPSKTSSEEDKTSSQGSTEEFASSSSQPSPPSSSGNEDNEARGDADVKSSSASSSRENETRENGDAKSHTAQPSTIEDGATATRQDAQSGPVDLEAYSSAAELEDLGLDRLKTALMDRGMKCGGTLQERAQRLFSVKGLDPSEIDPLLLAKSSKGKKGKKK